MKKKAEERRSNNRQVGEKRRRFKWLGSKKTGLVLILAILLSGIVFTIVNTTETTSRTIRSSDRGERVYYKVGGTVGQDWQPFEQDYALGYINLGESTQDRHCSDSASSVRSTKKYINADRDTRKKLLAQDICKFKGVKAKSMDYYIDYPEGAYYLGNAYDIREYIWSIKGGCVPSVNIAVVRSWYAGSIARSCDAITIREWHFYPAGTLGIEDEQTLVYKRPSEEELAQAEYSVRAGADHGFLGVMRLDDFDGNEEGYAFPIGNRGIWVVYNTGTTIKNTGSNFTKTTFAQHFTSTGSLTGGYKISYDPWKWVGNIGGTQSSNPRTAIWVQFESTGRNPDDPSDDGAPLTMAYYSTGHRSSISSQLVTIRYKLVSSELPQSIIDAMQAQRNNLRQRAENAGLGSNDCEADEDFTCDDDDDYSGYWDYTDSGGGGMESSTNYEATTASTVYEINTIKQFGITTYSSYDVYSYYDELIKILPAGYEFTGWALTPNVNNSTILQKDADGVHNEIIMSNRTYYGRIRKTVTPETNPGSCYSEL